MGEVEHKAEDAESCIIMHRTNTGVGIMKKPKKSVQQAIFGGCEITDGHFYDRGDNKGTPTFFTPYEVN
jgi:hypothetical protein